MPREPKGNASFSVSLPDLDAMLASAAKRPTSAPEDPPEVRRDRAAADDAELDVRLKKTVTRVAFVLMGAQVAVADIVFIVYGSLNSWHIPSPAIVAWLSAAVVEVIGVVLVMMQYLFPKRGK